MGITATHTYVTLEVSNSTYAEIRKKLLEAGYDHCFNEAGEIDMHGLALILEPLTFLIDDAGGGA